jgi:hypothetical protein
MRMDKEAIARKLANPFSYATVEIPTDVNIDGESINLKEKIIGIERIAEKEGLETVVPQVVELEKKLNKLFSDFVGKVERSEIESTEAEAQLSYYLGIKRAIVILKGISDESLKRFNEADERKQRAEDKKRWYKSARKLEEST